MDSAYLIDYLYDHGFDLSESIVTAIQDKLAAADELADYVEARHGRTCALVEKYRKAGGQACQR